MTTYNNIINRHCVIRTYSAGVHAGIVRNIEPTVAGLMVTLEDSVRIWRWEGAFSLSEVSQHGVGPSSRIAHVVPTILLSEAIEILPTTEESRKTLTTRNN